MTTNEPHWTSPPPPPPKSPVALANVPPERPWPIHADQGDNCPNCGGRQRVVTTNRRRTGTRVASCQTCNGSGKIDPPETPLALVTTHEVIAECMDVAANTPADDDMPATDTPHHEPDGTDEVDAVPYGWDWYDWVKARLVNVWAVPKLLADGHVIILIEGRSVTRRVKKIHIHVSDDGRPSAEVCTVDRPVAPYSYKKAALDMERFRVFPTDYKVTSWTLQKYNHKRELAQLPTFTPGRRAVKDNNRPAPVDPPKAGAIRITSLLKKHTKFGDRFEVLIDQHNYIVEDYPKVFEGSGVEQAMKDTPVGGVYQFPLPINMRWVKDGMYRKIVESFAKFPLIEPETPESPAVDEEVAEQVELVN